MKKVFTLLFAVWLVMLSACGSSGSKDTESTVRIGVFEPTTGVYAAGGTKELLGILYASQETPTISVAGKTYDVVVEVADCGETMEEAIAAAEELIQKDVSIVLGAYGSVAAMAGGPQFETAGIAAIGISCTNPWITAGNEYYFRICFGDSLQGAEMAGFAKETLQANTAYCLIEDGSEYGQDLIAFFRQRFEAAGGRIIVDSFSKDTDDFTAYFDRAADESADIIFLPVSTYYGTRILAQAKAISLDIPLLGSDTLDDNSVLNTIKDSTLHLYVATSYFEGSNTTFDDGVKEYIRMEEERLEANGGDDIISGVTALGYDAFYLALEAMRKTGSVHKADLLAQMPDISYRGITGDIRFDSMGNAIRNTVIIKAADPMANMWTLEEIRKLQPEKEEAPDDAPQESESQSEGEA